MEQTLRTVLEDPTEEEKKTRLTQDFQQKLIEKLREQTVTDQNNEDDYKRRIEQLQQTE